eukprot:403340223
MIKNLTTYFLKLAHPSFSKSHLLRESIALSQQNASQQPLIYTQKRYLVGIGHPPSKQEQDVKTFYFKIQNEMIEVRGRESECVLEVAHNHQLDMQMQGICGKCIVCATCHIYIPEDLADKIPRPIDLEIETLEDFSLLDYKPNKALSDQLESHLREGSDKKSQQIQQQNITYRSRLGCQVQVRDITEGCVIEVPVQPVMGLQDQNYAKNEQNIGDSNDNIRNSNSAAFDKAKPVF